MIALLPPAQNAFPSALRGRPEAPGGTNNLAPSDRVAPGVPIPRSVAFIIHSDSSPVAEFCRRRVTIGSHPVKKRVGLTGIGAALRSPKLV